MKNFVRIGSLVLALGMAGLLAACASSHQNVTQRIPVAHDFEVVETSTKRTLNAEEMAFLRAKVAEYLEKEGATASGNYYVKIFLGPDQEGVPAEWVVVRFSRDTDLRFELLGSDDTYYAGYRPYAAYDYYPYGYANYSRISFQYYDNPYYYGTGYYYPPRYDNHNKHHDHDRDRDHDGDQDHDHDRDKNRHGDHSRSADHDRSKPIVPAGAPPSVTRTIYDGNPSTATTSSRENNFPRHGGPPANQQRDRSAERASGQPNRTSSQSTPRTESSRNEPTRSEPSFRTSSQSAPSYSPPVSRSESHSSFKQNQREASQSDGQRERPE